MNPVDDARVGGDLLPPGLTPSQKEAITAQDRQLSVLAGAGAGKTRVLTLRVAQRVIVGDADPSRILVCTFTRKAAEELHQRLWRLEVDGVQSGTFHRLALSLLRQISCRGPGSCRFIAEYGGPATTIAT